MNADPPPPSGHLVVIGASAGGVAALLELAASLPERFPAPICVVQHVGNNTSVLPELLARRGVHPAVHARDGQHLTPGVIHVAPPDHHMLVEGEHIRLTRGPLENHTRPAIDPLFRSAALSWGAQVIGVILTGFLDDGTAGLGAVKDRGGIAVVEDPATAFEPSMPDSALQHVPVDYCVPIGEMGALLGRLVQAPDGPDAPAGPSLAREVAINRGEDLMENLQAIASPSSLTCPDCGGALWELVEQRPLRYRCHTGHAFTARTLDAAQAQAGEHAIRSTVRTLREREMLLRRMAAISEATGDQASAQAGRTQADRLHAQVDALWLLAETLDNMAPGAAAA